MGPKYQTESTVEELKAEIDQHIAVGIARDAGMARQMDELEEKVDILTKDVKSLLDMWVQARGIITFIKWMAGISGGVIAIVLFFKEHIK